MGGLRSHRRIHEGEAGKRYKCDKCPYKSFFKQCLDVHYRIHLGKWIDVQQRLEAGVTLKQNNTQTSTKSHLPCDASTLLSENQSKCMRTISFQMDCSNLKFLQNHNANNWTSLKIIFWDDRLYFELDPNWSSFGSGLKPYECDHCSKTFRTSSSVKIHIRMVHQGEEGKIFSCELCSFSTANKQSLKNHHRRIHLGYKVRASRTISGWFTGNIR